MGGGNFSHDEKKKIAILGVSSVLLVAMVAAVAVGVNRNEGGGGDAIATSQKNVDTLCQSTEYKETCQKSVAKASTESSDMKQLIKAAFGTTAEEIQAHLKNSALFEELGKDNMTKQALDVCKEVLDYAVKSVNDSIEKLDKFDFNKIGDFAYDLKVWLEATITHQHTCLDGFVNVNTDAGKKMAEVLKVSLELSNNALDIVNGFSDVFKNFDMNTINNRRLLSEDGFPSWVSQGQRRLIQVRGKHLKPDIVVAQDGSGKFKTLGDALKVVPLNNAKPFVIHVRAGVYKEKVIIPKNMDFITIVGDGPEKTRFTGNLNVVDGTQTFHSATFAVNGNNFMAVNVGFENTAGAVKQQAVALRITADKAVIYNCHMDGYQDTLYANTQRQFYRNCTISGTVDFVFGDAVAVFQNCTFIVRKPMDGQSCIVIAGGKDKVDGPSALVFQSCNFIADKSYLEWDGAKSGPKKTFLARPWRAFAKSVVMDSEISDIFHEEGYVPFLGETFQKTCTAYEYNNKGPGADVSKRVKWPGVKPKISPDEAQKYYPGKFFEISNASERDSWIVSAGVPYALGPM